MEIKIAIKNFPCHNYREKENGPDEVVTAIIVPHKIEVKDNTYHISYGCSMGQTCMNPRCRYSRMYRELEDKAYAASTGIVRPAEE